MHAISKGCFDEIVVDDEEDGASIENQGENIDGEQNPKAMSLKFPIGSLKVRMVMTKTG